MFDHQILLDEVSFTAIRSGGPGGQNVNKVSSSALLQWDYLSSFAISQNQKELVALGLANCINKDHQVYIKSGEFRDLERNKSRCFEKLVDYLNKALTIPKKRYATKPSYSSVIKKLDSKKKHGQVKKLRQKAKTFFDE